MEKLTLTVLEATKLLGVSRNLGYELARTGKLPTIRLGRRLVVPKAALERMLEGTAIAPGGDGGSTKRHNA